MSLVYNDTNTLKGIVQMYEREIGVTRGTVSGNTTLLKELTADVNLAFDDYLRLAFPVDGKWKLDDSNHTDMPEITTNLVQGQRSYSFTEDEQNNLILDIFAVYIKSGDTYEQITPVDPDTEMYHTGFYNGLDIQGVPIYYDKSANQIILDPIPETNVTDGLKVSINREASYFSYDDTTKKPGVNGLHHAYFYLKPAEDYARRNLLNTHNLIANKLAAMEAQITASYQKRTRDQKNVLKGKPIMYR
jgi:hypothetical protein